MRVWCVFLFSLIVSGALAVAGSNGVAPEHKSYQFERTDPQPKETVGHGDFREGDDEEGGEDPEGEYMDFNPITGSPMVLEQGSDGQYRLFPDPDTRSVCFLDTDVPKGASYRFEFKDDGVVFSEGVLID